MYSLVIHSFTKILSSTYLVLGTKGKMWKTLPAPKWMRKANICISIWQVPRRELAQVTVELRGVHLSQPWERSGPQGALPERSDTWAGLGLKG